MSRKAKAATPALPATLTSQELAAFFGISYSTAWRREKEGAFALFELLPRIGPRPTYSGKRLQAWLDGDLAGPQAYASRRHFGHAR